ncbi:MAG: LamG domain-containing protein, partial [Candidatus Nanoarchaeia archaeon]|nr:LamG domain-containing protein [Candidatus Nanoarchaeia archaeon]
HFVNSTLTTNNFIWTCIACTAEGCTASSENRTLRVDVTPPTLVQFVSPTPENETKRATNYNEAYVNVSITEASNNYSASIDWNRSLVGWWRLEQGNGTWFEDSSTWGNNGTCAPSSGYCPNLTTGMRGKAYNFNGINNNINLGNYNELEGMTSITIAVWVKPTGTGDVYQRIIDKTYNTAYALTYLSPNVNFALVTDTGSINDVSCGDLTDNVWNHLVAVWNNRTSTYECYVNGIASGEGGTLTGNNVATNGATLYIGGWGGGTANNFNGSIDEVMLWNRALSPEEINASYSAGVWKLYRNFTGLTSGTYTYKAYVVDQAGNLNNTEQRTFIINTPPTHDYPAINTTLGTNTSEENITAFNISTTDADGDAVTNIWNWYMNGTSITLLNMPFEGGSQNGTSSGVANGAKNYVPGMNNGTVYNATWSSTAGVDGRGAYKFDGVDDYIDTSLNIPGGNFSFSLWFYMNQDATAEGASKYLLYFYPQVLYQHSANNYLYFYGYTGGQYLGWQPSNNAWHHLACSVRTNVSITCFGDGAYKATDAKVGEFMEVSSIRISNSGANAWNGTIDNVMIYNRSLTNESMLALYANQTNRIVQQETSSGETWSACLTPNDGQDDGATMCTRANITINTPPSKVTLAEPTHGNNTLTNRSVSFRWLAAADVDGNSLTYNISINCYSLDGGSCSPSDDRMYSTSATSYNLTEETELRYLYDDRYYYNWSVTAYDSFDYGEASNQSNFSINSEVIVSLINDTVDFGELNINQQSNTTDFTPYPMRLENKGNVITTVNLSSATQLFSSGGFPSSYFKIRVNETSGYEGCFSNNASSQISWTNVPAVNNTLFDKMNYSSGNDRGDIHLHIQVPNDEPSGSKSSILTLTGWYAL